MFLIITRDTMFFTAMKNILSNGNVVHIQNEEEIDVMLHQNAFVIIDTLMNNEPPRESWRLNFLRKR